MRSLFANTHILYNGLNIHGFGYPQGPGRGCGMSPQDTEVWLQLASESVVVCAWLGACCWVSLQLLWDLGHFRIHCRPWVKSEAFCLAFGNVFWFLDVSQALLVQCWLKVDGANKFFGRSVKCPKHGRSIYISHLNQMCSSLYNPLLVTQATPLQN